MPDAAFGDFNGELHDPEDALDIAALKAAVHGPFYDYETFRRQELGMTDQPNRLRVKHEGWRHVDGLPRPLAPRPKE